MTKKKKNQKKIKPTLTIINNVCLDLHVFPWTVIADFLNSDPVFKLYYTHEIDLCCASLENL